MSTIKHASLEELRAMKQRGETLPTRSDATPEDLPDDFWDDAVVEKPQTKQSVHLRVDPEVLEYFREGGKGHLTRMNAVLKSYVEAQKRRDKRHTPS